MILKIMTFNTQHCKNYITKKIDYNSIVNIIKKHDIDIIGLNEVYGNFQVKQIANKLGYYYYFGKSTNILFLKFGNAIISKYPIIEFKKIQIPFIKVKEQNSHYEKRSILEAKIKIKKSVINVYITHLGLNEVEQLNGINTLLDNVNTNSSIIMGDFNIIPSNKNINKILKYFNNASNDNTWPSNKPIKKIDYIFISKDLCILDSNVLKDIVSDHNPIIAKIKTH